MELTLNELMTNRERKLFDEIKDDWQKHRLNPYPHEIDLMIKLIERFYDLQKTSSDASGS